MLYNNVAHFSLLAKPACHECPTPSISLSTCPNCPDCPMCPGSPSNCPICLECPTDASSCPTCQECHTSTCPTPNCPTPPGPPSSCPTSCNENPSQCPTCPESEICPGCPEPQPLAVFPDCSTIPVSQCPECPFPDYPTSPEPYTTSLPPQNPQSCNCSTCPGNYKLPSSPIFPSTDSFTGQSPFNYIQACVITLCI